MPLIDDGRTTLTTERLLLRPLALSDVDDVMAYAVDEEWSRYLDLIVPFPYSRQDAEKFVAACVLQDWTRNGPHFALEYEGRVVGSVDLSLNRHRAADLGYSLARERWGQGLMTEAVGAVINYGFEVAGVERIEAWADLRNAGSWRVMEKCGMAREGVFRAARPDRMGGRSDDVHYAILKSEWARSANRQTSASSSQMAQAITELIHESGRTPAGVAKALRRPPSWLYRILSGKHQIKAIDLQSWLTNSTCPSPCSIAAQASE